MTVKVRRKNHKKGTSIYLDTYYAKNDRKTETIYRSIPENDLNKYIQLASKEAKKREERYRFITHSYCDVYNINVAEYLSLFSTMYFKKDIKKVNAMVKKFCEFQTESCIEITFQNFNQTILEMFASFLSIKLNGETPKTYFNCLIRILKQFHKRNMLDISIFELETIKLSTKKNKKVKEIVTSKELLKIRDIETKFIEVKKAFLFSCFSGLGLAECKILDWSMITDDNVLDINRCKNDAIINVKINQEIIDLLGVRKKNGRVFDFYSSRSKDGFLSDNTINKYLSNIIKQAKVKKHITFYCARHSYAGLLLKNGLENKSEEFQKFVLSKALGHASLNSTLPYLNNYHDSLYKITESMTF